MPIFLDTHAWIWWVTRDRRLSRRAFSTIRNAVSQEGVWISAISIWKVAKRVEKNQLDRPLRQWLDSATSIPGLFIAELSNDILIDSCDLPAPFHGDPADQMIVATVRRYDARLITKDQQLRRYLHIQCLW